MEIEQMAEALLKTKYYKLGRLQLLREGRGFWVTLINNKKILTTNPAETILKSIEIMNRLKKGVK